MDKISPLNPLADAIKETKHEADHNSLPRYYIDVRNFEYEYDEAATSISFKYNSTRELPNLHGAAALPFGYSWASVPPRAVISFAEPRAQSPGMPNPRISIIIPLTVCSNYNWMQSLIAIFQAGSAGLTLYKSRGDQIQRYGYAAFGLTVVPYLVMSILNLISQITTADYPNLYMVESPEMEEARRHGGTFDGVVGSLVRDDDAKGGYPTYKVKTARAPIESNRFELGKIRFDRFESNLYKCSICSESN
jgi:hypothetical protein